MPAVMLTRAHVIFTPLTINNLMPSRILFSKEFKYSSVNMTCSSSCSLVSFDQKMLDASWKTRASKGSSNQQLKAHLSQHVHTLTFFEIFGRLEAIAIRLETIASSFIKLYNILSYCFFVIYICIYILFRY